MLQATPPDRRAKALQAHAGFIYYAQKVGRSWRERRLASAPSPRFPAPVTLPIPPAFFPISVQIGEDPAGRSELSYARCEGRRRCEPHAFALPDGPERQVPIRRLEGCQVHSFLRWRSLAAYDLAPARTGSCPPRSRGLWAKLAGHPPHLLTRRPFIVDFVHGHQIVYSDFKTASDRSTIVRLRLWSVGARRVTLGHASADECDLEVDFGSAVYDHGYIYWNHDCDSSTGGPSLELERARLAHPRCVSRISDYAAVEQSPDFAVDAGNVLYAEPTGIFDIAPGRLRWPVPRCA